MSFFKNIHLLFANPQYNFPTTSCCHLTLFNRGLCQLAMPTVLNYRELEQTLPEQESCVKFDSCPHL